MSASSAAYSSVASAYQGVGVCVIGIVCVGVGVCFFSSCHDGSE